VVGGDRYWYIDQQGHRAIEGEFAAASRFFKGVAHVRELAGEKAKTGAAAAYIDTKGRRIFRY
jgi:hypothetical protein